MTRPRDFIFNTDYLALAQSDRKELQFDIAAKTISPYSTGNDGMGKNVTANPGAIDRFYLSIDGNNWNVASSLKKVFENNTDLFMKINASRASNNSIRIRIEYTNKTASGYTFPATTIYVRLDSFKPPNVL